MDNSTVTQQLIQQQLQQQQQQQQQQVAAYHHRHKSATHPLAISIPGDPNAQQRKPCACAHLHPGKSCLAFVVNSFGRSFYLAYGLRAGISLTLHVIKLLRSKEPLKIFDLNELVSAHGLPIDAVRMGLFLGGFTGIYNGIRCALARWTGKDNAYTVMGAGTVAGLSLLWQGADSHRTLALYVWARVFQCWYNKSKTEGKWHFWGSDWQHGDSLLFSLCTAQVMYSYVMRPETLPPSYFSFIVNTGPIPLQVLDQVKANNRGLPIDMEVVKSVYQKYAPKGSAPIEGILAKLATNFYGPGASPLLPPLLPCALLHPQNPQCSHQWLETFVNSAKRILPVYLSLTFVPMFVLRFWLLVKHPIDQLQRGLWSVTKSTSFLASFVTIYMFNVCMHRRLFLQDHRSLYWVSGFIAAWTILLEQKSRRSELALYVLPRTIDSLIQTMQSRQMLANIPHGEKGLFCLGMGALMYYREYHPESMSPLLRRVLNFFVPTHKVAKDHPQPLTSTHTGTSTPHLQQPYPIDSNVDTSSSMKRIDSDGISASMFMPLPQPGISLSRESSFSVNRPSGGNSSYGLFARDISPAASATPYPSPPASSPTVAATNIAASSNSSLGGSPPTESGLSTPSRNQRGGSFVHAKIDEIEQHIAHDSTQLYPSPQSPVTELPVAMPVTPSPNHYGGRRTFSGRK